MKKNTENVGYYNKFLLTFAISVNIINQIEKHFCFCKTLWYYDENNH